MSEQQPVFDDFDLTEPAGYSHWSVITIRCRDEDQLGHVNNSVYSEWFEVARVTLTRRISAPGPDWLVTALARMTINFLGETTWPGEVRVGGRLLSVGNRSFRSAYAVFRDDRCLATADCVSVYFDRRSRGSTTPPPEVRETMEAELRSATCAARPAPSPVDDG
jgi:acyl-CoA thioester hydrolase